MKILGIDFDNTIVKYDNLFHKIALEKGLIDTSAGKRKKEIRDYLRSRNKGGEFTLLQGEVYGLRITVCSRPCRHTPVGRAGMLLNLE